MHIPPPGFACKTFSKRGGTFYYLLLLLLLPLLPLLPLLLLLLLLILEFKNDWLYLGLGFLVLHVVQRVPV